MARILLVLSAHDRLAFSTRRSGVWLDEFAIPWFSYVDAGHEVVVAAPTGGRPPVDEASAAESSKTPWTRRYDADPAAELALSATVALSDVDPNSIDAVHVAGGYPQLVDVVGHPPLIRIIESVAARRAPLALLCHGVSVLRDVRTPDGRPFASGRRVTSFTRSEEESLDLEDVVPFLVEDLLREQGAVYLRSDVDWTPFVVRDDTLVTGQNPSSTEGVVDLVLELLTSGR